MNYLKYLFIVLIIYLLFDIFEYIVLKFIKRVDYKNYFDFIKQSHFNKNKKQQKEDIKNSEE